MLRYLDNPKISDLEQMYEETSAELLGTTWPRIVARVKSQNIRAEYLKCDKNGKLYFRTTSGTSPGKWWYQEIEFVDLNKAIKMLKSSLLVRKKKIIQMLISGDIKCYCNCPCWHYYFKYTAWKNGYGIYKETRPSKIRNPHQDHSLDKHLCAVLYLLPQISNRILSDYSKQKVFPSFFNRVKSRFFNFGEEE